MLKLGVLLSGCLSNLIVIPIENKPVFRLFSCLGREGTPALQWIRSTTNPPHHYPLAVNKVIQHPVLEQCSYNGSVSLLTSDTCLQALESTISTHPRHPAEWSKIHKKQLLSQLQTVTIHCYSNRNSKDVMSMGRCHRPHTQRWGTKAQEQLLH